MTVDNLEVAQFIYLLLHREKLRNVINTLTSKAVLILGRFTPDHAARIITDDPHARLLGSPLKLPRDIGQQLGQGNPLMCQLQRPGITGHRFWRMIHYLSFVVFLLALAHGLLSGTDARMVWARGMYLASGGSVLFLAIYRGLSARFTARQSRDAVRAAPRDSAR